MTWLIALLGIGFTAMGGWAAVDPSTFPAVEFPPYNEHLIHDIAAMFLCFGIGLLAAARLVSWRTPVLTLAAIWNAFHTVSHLVDIHRGSSEAVGVRAAVEVGAVTLVLAALAWWSHRAETPRG